MRQAMISPVCATRFCGLPACNGHSVMRMSTSRVKKKAGRRSIPPAADPISTLRVNLKRGDNRKTTMRLLGLLALLLTTVASLGVIVWLGAHTLGRRVFSENDRFRMRGVKDCEIQCAGEVITRMHVMEYADLSECANIFALDIAEMRRHLLSSVPRLKSVDIYRKLPNKLVIRVRERAAVARVAVGEYFLAVDREGMVLGPASGLKPLPAISGLVRPGVRPGVVLADTAVMNALDVLEVCDTTPIGQSVKVAEVDVSPQDGVELRLIGGEQIPLAWTHMGDRTSLARENLEQKMIKLGENLKASSARGKRIVKMDMTLDNNFPAQEIDR